MLKQTIHKGLQVGKHQTIARASILRRCKPIHQISYIFVARALVVMLAKHYTYGISHSTTVHSATMLATLRGLKELITIGEQHLLLLL